MENVPAMNRLALVVGESAAGDGTGEQWTVPKLEDGDIFVRAIGDGLRRIVGRVAGREVQRNHWL